MNIRLENIHTEASPANYVSFLNQPPKSRGDRDSIHSVSSVRSVMSGMSVFWSSFGIGSSGASSKSEKAKAAVEQDLKYLYSAFTKIPCLRLSPDHRARLISGYEEFPFDTAVPLHTFKNLSALEIIDVDFRSFFGWDRLAEQLRTLTVKRANLDDIYDLLTAIVLDDIDKRRRRSSKAQSSPIIAWPSTSSRSDFGRSNSAPGSPIADAMLSTSASPRNSLTQIARSEHQRPHRSQTGNTSPTRPTTARHGTSYRHVRGSSTKLQRSGSGSSNSSDSSHGNGRSPSVPNILSMGLLPPNKWRFLRHLSLADNSLTSISVEGLAPLANTLHSLDLSSNLFTEVPDSLATLISLRALNLSNCMIESLHSLARHPLPAITALNLRGNRLRSIAGIERLLSLERLDLRYNRLDDPTEIARLTGIPYIRDIYVSHNPFVKTHSNYRITIFNLFRRIPGYSEDIMIDSTGPGYSERKKLVERAAEVEAPRVMRPPDLDEPPLTAPEKNKPAVVQMPASERLDKQLKPQRPIPPSIQSDYAVGSARRRKSSRRRIVDLSETEMPLKDSSLEQAQILIRQVQADLPPVKDLPARPLQRSESQRTNGSGPRIPDRTSSKSREPASETSRPTVSQQPVQPPVRAEIRKVCEDSDDDRLEIRREQSKPATQESPERDTTGDAYRKRLEAIKNEVGNNWLSVLGEDNFKNGGKAPSPASGRAEYSHPPTLRQESHTSMSSSHAITTGTRTIG